MLPGCPAPFGGGPGNRLFSAGIPLRRALLRAVEVPPARDGVGLALRDGHRSPDARADPHGVGGDGTTVRRGTRGVRTGNDDLIAATPVQRLEVRLLVEDVAVGADTTDRRVHTGLVSDAAVEGLGVADAVVVDDHAEAARHADDQ